MELEFGQRLNLLTGDNGLGKSFLLDIAWWAMTRKWPAETNPGLTAGKKALPASDSPARIEFSFTGKKKEERYLSEFQPREQAWTGRPGRPSNPGLVIYAMADGSFAVWDPARNYWRVNGSDFDLPERIPAYVFCATEVWDGLQGNDGKPVCNGLVLDWAGWQKQRGAAFRHLRSVLDALSPSPHERLEPGRLTRISLDDARDMPTIRMPYGQDVAILHASAGMRRIFALAYLLVWTWEEHKKAAALLREDTAKQVVFLIDEIESHLHPQWQRKIIPALFSVVQDLIPNSTVQILAATHSPLIMASAEPLFDLEKDAWFDIDMQHRKVTLRRRDFEKHGDAAGWLISEAFDLKSGRSVEYEHLVAEAAGLMEKETVDPNQVRRMNEKLVHALSPKDDFLLRWRFVGTRKGWLE
jgi:predicted ATPase